MIAVYYREDQNVADNDSFSPSAGKPQKVYELFRNNSSVEIFSNWSPISREDFYLSHDQNYVNKVLDLVGYNGFDNKNPNVAKSLPYSSGSFYHAALHALKYGVAMSPTSGFHHAKYASGGSFCTFNGLTIAAQLLKKKRKVKKVGIIDFDNHYGNGTVDIIEHLKLKYISHLSYGFYADKYKSSEIWLYNLKKDLHRFKDCDILFYQAGADAHINDPLGGDLTTEQMKQRDAIVFEFAKSNKIPIVWNLAGGYQEDFNKVLELHENTLKECIAIYEN